MRSIVSAIQRSLFPRKKTSVAVEWNPACSDYILMLLPLSCIHLRLRFFTTFFPFPVDRLRVGDCNATRVGGRVPQPNSIALLDRAGCSLNPHIIGHMQRHGSRLEAPLSAFRIDGSDQIDIVCTVLVCRARCTREVREAGERPYFSDLIRPIISWHFWLHYNLLVALAMVINHLKWK